MHPSLQQRVVALSGKRKALMILTVFALGLPLYAFTLEGRLPGEQFREDNPPRFGAVMSFVSKADSIVVVEAKAYHAKMTVAKLLQKIAKGFKIHAGALRKTALVEGALRWLQYTFRKKDGGGFVYITRQGDAFIYLVIFNLSYDSLSRDLPYIDRYIKQLNLKKEGANE